MLKFSLFTRFFPKARIRSYSNNQQLSIIDILRTKNVGEEVTVKGWVKSLRNQKENVFLDLSDGSSYQKLQILISKSLKPQELSTGASVLVSGCLSKSPKGQLELSANKIEIYGECVISEGYPFAPRKEYTPEYIRQHLHFRPRTNKFSALLRVRNRATLALYEFFDKEGFVNVHTPILTSNDCEGAGEVFKVIPESGDVLKTMSKEGQKEDEVYFDTKAFLTVSGQLHLEAVAHGLSKVFTFGPTFRAENSRSRLHLSEFYMVEGEIAFLQKLNSLTDFVEKMMKNVSTKVLEATEDIALCKEENHDFHWLDKKFPVLTYKEALKVISKHFPEVNPAEGFTKEHELFLVKHCGNIPVFLINFPKEMKPFYMKETPDGDTVEAFDLLTPVTGEIIGGSLRESDIDRLESKLKNLPRLHWYLDLRKFGGVPTGGFGLGFERYLQFLLGINNIKDVIPFPRWPHNCSL